MSAAVLSLRGVSKAFGAVQALRDVSFDCRAGEMHALVGENGSGKSTLLGIASGFVPPDQGTSRSAGSSTAARLSRRGPEARPRAWRTRPIRTSSTSRSPRTSTSPSPGEPAAVVRPHGGVGLRKARGVRARRPGDGADRVAVARGTAVPRGDQGAARPAEGPAPGRADDGARAGGRRAPARARARAEPRRGRHRLRQPPAAGGARHRRPRHRPPRRRLPGHVRGRRHVRGEPRRADDRPAAPARVSRSGTPPTRAEDALLAVSGLQGDRFGPIDLEVAKGEIVGIAGAEGNGQVPFLRALAGAERSTGSATCNGRELDTGSPLGPLRAGVVLLSGDRTGRALFPVLSVRANTTIQVLRRLGTPGLPQPPARARHGRRRSRAA